MSFIFAFDGFHIVIDFSEVTHGDFLTFNEVKAEVKRALAEVNVEDLSTDEFAQRMLVRELNRKLNLHNTHIHGVIISKAP